MLDERTIRKVEGHLRGTFANARITLVPRPKQKDSAEVYIGEEFVGVLFVDDEDDPGRRPAVAQLCQQCGFSQQDRGRLRDHDAVVGALRWP